MPDPDKKDIRRQKLTERTQKKFKVSEEQRHIAKVKKQHKNKLQEMQAEEKWQDWEEEY